MRFLDQVEFDGPIELPIFTLATRPLATGAPEMIFVSDAATGHQFQYANGVAWIDGPDLSIYAPLASPVFTGTIGIPVYTLATRPAVSVGAGKLVFVSDAVSGTKLQWSDGTTWQSAIAVLNNLSADTPDKLIWKTAGGTIIELWGQETAAGYQPQNVDTFTTAGYVNNWLVNGFGPTFAGDQLQVVNPGDNNMNLTRGDWGTFGDQTSMSVRFRWRFAGGYHNSWVRMGYTPLADAANSDSAHLVARLGMPFPEDGLYHLWIEASGKVDLGSIAASVIDSDAAGWLRITCARNGNQITASLVRESDNAVLISGTVADVNTLSGGAPYAAGTNHYPYLSARGLDPGFYFDDFTESVSSPEARDLMVAITPAGGARTTRRLFGSSGLTLRSDLVTNALLTTKGDLIAATGAGAPARMAAAGVAGNVMTEDPTVASGWKSAAPAGAAVEAPHLVGADGGLTAFAGNWGNESAAAGGYARLSYYKDRGRLYVSGVIRSGTTPPVPAPTSTLVTTLPAGYRPTDQHFFIGKSYTNDAGTGATPTEIYIQPDGTIRVGDQVGANLPAARWCLVEFSCPL